ITSYSWNFGDGSTSSQQNPSHTFNYPGTYTITLTVTDNDGKTGTNTLIINVDEKENQLPIVSPTANTLSGVAPLEVHFTGTASDPDGSIVSYLWDFGDGQTSSQQNPTHTFQIAGSHSVKFTATDNKGGSAYNFVIITVLEDTDGDGIPDIDDPDDDNDGYLDTVDLFQKKDAKIKITLKKYKVIDETDPAPENTDAEVFFQIDIQDKFQTHIPPDPTVNYWKTNIGELRTINESFIYDCADNIRGSKINIQMWDYDGGIWSELIDIDGHDSTFGITVNYDIVLGTWTGDNTTGITNGSDDGTQLTDDNDAYLEYWIETI
ncbi:MAG: PKD domain-containing protein, partial [Candidatus Thermoplasmatota archaeon]|nr:PKD domain-containing protein [Candidatus Thermoplasmatota archaeon]